MRSARPRSIAACAVQNSPENNVFSLPCSLAAAAFLDQRDEVLVDVLLDRLDALHVLRLLRQERIEHHLALAGGVEPALDAELFHQLGEAERAADHADRADDRKGIADDLVGGAGQHVAAGGADILDEGDDRKLLFLGQLPDAAEDQMRLRRRAARRIDDQRHGARVAHREGALQRAGDRSTSISPGRNGVTHADDARQPHHRHHRDVGAKARRHQLRRSSSVRLRMSGIGWVAAVRHAGQLGIIGTQVKAAERPDAGGRLLRCNAVNIALPDQEMP